jgi:sec-independent protein translocase protein TatA
MFGMGTGEMIVIGIVLIVLFGAKKLPELGSGLGKALRGFQRSMHGTDEKPVKPIEERPMDADEKPVKPRAESDSNVSPAEQRK